MLLVLTISIVALILIFLLVRYLALGQSVSTRLYSVARKSETDGRFEQALSEYQTALVEAHKKRHNKDLKNKIVQKIKILHTVIQYERGI